MQAERLTSTASFELSPGLSISTGSCAGSAGDGVRRHPGNPLDGCPREPDPLRHDRFLSLETDWMD
jgi:hypothetical protein